MTSEEELKTKSLEKSFKKEEHVKFDSRLKNNLTKIKMERDPHWKPHFIFALNDIELILNSNKFDSRLSKKIQFLTVDPGTQRIGSFHPKDINFYRDAYQPISFSKLPILEDKKMRTVWLKAMNELPPNEIVEETQRKIKENPNMFFDFEKDHSKDPFQERYQKFIMRNKQDDLWNIVREEIWFEAFPPKESNKIELEFRKFLIYGNPERFAISNCEIIDFSYWRLFRDSNHQILPNSVASLHRHTFSGDDGYNIGSIPTLAYSSFY